jgi:hypothetical protein
VQGRFADGMNGVLVGTCERDGKRMTFEWAHMHKMYAGYTRDDGTCVPSRFSLVSCG